MLMEFSTFPAGPQSLSGAVAKVIDLIDQSGLPYQTHALGTLVEGEWDELMDLVKRCHHVLKQDYERVMTQITIDDRRGAKNRLQGKVEAIEKKLGRKISK